MKAGQVNSRPEPLLLTIKSEDPYNKKPAEAGLIQICYVRRAVHQK